MKNLIFCLTVILSVFFLTACGSSDSAGENKTNSYRIKTLESEIVIPNAPGETRASVQYFRYNDKGQLTHTEYPKGFIAFIDLSSDVTARDSSGDIRYTY